MSKIQKRADGMAQVVEHLPTKCKASTTKKKKKKKIKGIENKTESGECFALLSLVVKLHPLLHTAKLVFISFAKGLFLPFISHWSLCF
jgi:hypothetical protein